MSFVDRHVGIGPEDEASMLEALGYDTVEALLDDAVPGAIHERDPLAALPAAVTEDGAHARLRQLADRNQVLTSLIGMGYHASVTPAVIRRNVLEDPAWYTAYTPYQPEISQGRLEVLLAFQTMVADLTGLDVANASLLDEATAAAEAVAMAARLVGGERRTLLVDTDCHPQTLEVVATRAEPVGVKVVVGDPWRDWDDDAFAVLVQHPGSSGRVRDLRPVADTAHAHAAVCIAATDLLACALVTPPGELGADIAVGSAQRFGLPLWFGGPHAGFLATRAGSERSLPGRLVGASVDVAGNRALRLALQTREQHIRRERATSNICTAQVLPAVVSALFAMYHGPDGLRAIAERVHGLTVGAGRAFRSGGFEVANAGAAFDTLTVQVPGRADETCARARSLGLNLRRVDADRVGFSLDETSDADTVGRLLESFGVGPAGDARAAGRDRSGGDRPGADDRWLPEGLVRQTPFLTHPVFHRYRSETEMLRELRRLSDMDLALDRTMIPLGSCTMKLNAAAEMEPISWPGFTDLHPFVPADQSAGTRALIAELEAWLAEVTGYDAVSVQPNAGSQGELAGLLAVRAYHRSRGDERDVCLIPGSAHGTNAASAVMAGFRVVVVATDATGGVDLEDLRAKAGEHADRLAAVMVTYPSTHGVFEDTVVEVCEIVHAAGGQVYLDGANLNALVGLARPGRFGADVSHLNLHKTFCIPHGGGGPGVGPVAVRAHLAPFLPSSSVVPEAGPEGGGVGAVAAAPWGSAGVLPISWTYIAMMGAEGLTRATATAILSANYVARRLSEHYPVLYTGRHGLVAHECIVDLRPLTKATGVSVDDVAKRLVDFGFHAPTVSFPVAGTLMVEPTESESRRELDRFCDAMAAIRQEIREVEDGRVALADSALRNAPHTAEAVTAQEWDRPYTRVEAAFPADVDPRSKYWPPVGRVDGAHGDRNLMCSCTPMEELEDLG